MTIKGEIDTSAWDAALANLSGPGRVSLARSMAVAGGQVLRDEAKLHAPKLTGRLSQSIYLAFRESESTDRQVTYVVTWNAKLAPHGHLIEFGHWQTYAVIKTEKGWFTDKTRPLTAPRYVPAEPFLRPALSATPRAKTAMVARGRERLPEILRGAADEP